jgi:hypothetical protein
VLIDDVLSNEPAGESEMVVESREIEQSPSVVFGNADYYVQVHLKQGSQEWLEWRHDGIGASDAAVIMGENPWKDAEALLIQKCEAPTARELSGTRPLANGLFKSNDASYLPAGLDGSYDRATSVWRPDKNKTKYSEAQKCIPDSSWARNIARVRSDSRC